MRRPWRKQKGCCPSWQGTRLLRSVSVSSGRIETPCNAHARSGTPQGSLYACWTSNSAASWNSGTKHARS